MKQRWDFSATEVTEKELVALVAGEPDATLFDVPAHYREVPPSERMFGPNKENPGCNEHARKVLKAMDEEYERLRLPAFNLSSTFVREIQAKQGITRNIATSEG